MTTQDDKTDSAQGNAKTQLRPSAADWTLMPKDPQHKGQIFPVRGEMLIGREGCDVTLKSQHTSRKHAKVSLAGGVLRVEDLGSANGTFVNDERVEVSELKPGDEVRFDTEAFLVDGPESKPAQDAGDDQRTALRQAPPEETLEPAAEPAPEPESEPARKASSKKKAARKAARKAAPKKKAAPEKKAEDKGAAAESEAASAEKPATGDKAEPQSAERQAAPEKSAEPEKQPAPEKPPAAEADAPGEKGQEEPARGAWYERDTPNMTRKVDSGALQDQFAEGATQIVRGVQGVEMPSLIGTSGDWAGKIIKLEKEAMTIGRAGTDIILDEPSVSTKHAQIVRDGERWKIVDLMSANGVYVNGKKTQVAYLAPGDAVRFGRLEMRFVIDSTEVQSHAAEDTDTGDVIVGASRSPSKGGTWLYVAIGFVVVVVVGAYLLLAG